jgi:hypothetical protein
MKKIEIEILLYTLTKKFMEFQRNMLNAFGIILFYKVMGWFDGQNIVGSFIVLILHDVFVAYGFFLFLPFTNISQNLRGITLGGLMLIIFPHYNHCALP